MKNIAYLFVALAMLSSVVSAAETSVYVFVETSDFPVMEDTGGLQFYSAANARVGGLVPAEDLEILGSCSTHFADGSFVARKVSFIFTHSIKSIYGVTTQKGVVYFPVDKDQGRGLYGCRTVVNSQYDVEGQYRPECFSQDGWWYDINATQFRTLRFDRR